jgi:hypothetical protein
LCQELELLRQAPPDDGIIAIQSQGQRLAVQYLLADVRLEQPPPFPGRGRSLPLHLPRQAQAVDVPLGNHNPPCRGGLGLARLEQRMEAEQRGAYQQEVQQRFSK